MGKINGKPSIYVIPAVDAEQFETDEAYEAHIASVVKDAMAWVEGLRQQSDDDPLNDPQTQAELDAWHEERDAEWRNDPEAQRRFDEWVTEQETQALEAEMEAEAEAAELASLGVAGQHAIAGHDSRWQKGGA